MPLDKNVSSMKHTLIWVSAVTALTQPVYMQLRDAWPGKAQKMLKSRNRGAGGDGKKLKTSNKVPGNPYS